MTVIVRAGGSKGEIIVGDNKDKLEDKDGDVEIGDGVGGKDRDDVGYSFSRGGEFINADDEEKCEDRAAGTERCNQVGGGDRDDVNPEFSGDNTCEETPENR